MCQLKLYKKKQKKKKKPTSLNSIIKKRTIKKDMVDASIETLQKKTSLNSIYNKEKIQQN